MTKLQKLCEQLRSNVDEAQAYLNDVASVLKDLTEQVNQEAATHRHNATTPATVLSQNMEIEQ